MAALPPIAGSTPMRMPTSVDHSSRNGRDRISQITLRCETRERLTPRPPSPPAAARRIASFSMSVMICAKAKTPISTGRNGKPPPRNSEPKVKRGTLPIGSVPITVIRRPMRGREQPLDERGFGQPRHHRHRQHEQREELPRPELERDRRERPGDQDQEQRRRAARRRTTTRRRARWRGPARLCAPSESRRTSWRSPTACRECRAGTRSPGRRPSRRHRRRSSPRGPASGSSP